MSEAGVIDQDNLTRPKIALVYGQMNEPPGARLRVALAGLAITEYFRDEKNQDVLLFIDNIFRFSQAGSEVSALLGRAASPSATSRRSCRKRGPPRTHYFNQVRFDHFLSGGLRARRRPDRPLAGHDVCGLGPTIVLDRAIAELGIYPAADPLASPPGAGTEIVGAGALRCGPWRAQGMQRDKGLQDIIRTWAWTNFPRRISLRRLRPQDPAVPRVSRSACEVFTGREGNRSVAAPFAASRRFSTASTTMCRKDTSTLRAGLTR